MHLDERRQAELLGGILSRAEALALASHLGTGCDLCEAFLARHGRADAADGWVDRALSALAAGGPPGTEGEFRRIESALAAGAPSREDGDAPRGAGRGRSWRPLLAAAALLLVAGVAALVARAPATAPAPAWDGLKGEAGPAPVRLRFDVVAGEGASAEIRPGTSGEAVPATAALRFEVDLVRRAHVALVRLAPAGVPERVWEGEAGPGPTAITVGDRAAVYPLAGLSGRQRFVAVASDVPLAGDAVERAAATGGPGTSAVEVRLE